MNWDWQTWDGCLLYQKYERPSFDALLPKLFLKSKSKTSKSNFIVISMKWDARDPNNIILVTGFSWKMPKSIYINTYIYYIHYTLYIYIYILFTKGIDTFSPGRSEIFWAQNIRQQKLIKVFELYQFFQWQNVSIIPYCILLTRIKSISQ